MPASPPDKKLRMLDNGAEGSLDGDLAFELLVGAIGEEDGGHAALSDFADEAVGADEGAGFEALEAFEGGAYAGADAVADEVGVVVGGGEKAFEVRGGYGRVDALLQFIPGYSGFSPPCALEQTPGFSHIRPLASFAKILLGAQG